MSRQFKNGDRYRAADILTQGYLAFVGLIVVLFHGESVPGWAALAGAHLLVLGAVHGLITAPRGRFRDFMRDFYPILLIPLLWREIGLVNQVLVASYQDALFIRCDQWLFGFQPGAELMDLFPGRWTGELFYGAYFSYYLMIVGTGVALHRKNRGHFREYLFLLCLVLFGCYVVYLFLPVIGARVFIQDFDGFRLPEGICDVTWPHPYPEAVTEGFMYGIMDFLYRYFEVDGAAFPSSHVAVSLCTVTFSWRYLKRVRWLHLIAFILLCISTVYCRYHYAVDVLAGLLYGGALCLVGQRVWRSSRAMSTPSTA